MVVRLPELSEARLFKQGIPALELSVEQGTGSVPDDGRYHVVHAGAVISSHARENEALRAYRRLRDELAEGAAIPQPDAATAAEALRRERTHYESQSVLAESGRRRGDHGRRKGGKGR